MLQLFEFDEDLNESSCQLQVFNQWSTRNTTSFKSLPEDIWIEIFSFFPTSEKLSSLILISKSLQSPIYKSIKSLKLIGIDHTTTTNNSTTTTSNGRTRVAYSEDDKWLMSPITTNKPSVRNLSYASRMSTSRRLNKLTNPNTTTNTTSNHTTTTNNHHTTTTRLHSSSLPSLSDLYNQEEEEVNPLISLLNPFSKITELSLEFCKALDSETLCKILCKFTHLQTLTIIHCSSLNSINITYPMEVCKNLKRLEIRDCRSIQECAGGIKLDCYLLEHLSITSTPCISERLLSNLIDRNCNTLKSINLFSLDFTNISITKKMNQLQSISLQRCKNFTRFHLPIKQVCLIFPKLVELDLSFTNINDESIKCLTFEQKLENLIEFKLENCKSLQKPMIGNCPQLRKLSLDFCSSLEDLSILGNHCPLLEILSINYTKITDKSIERIFPSNYNLMNENDSKIPPPITKLSAKKCKSIYNPKITSYHLQDLDLNGCYNISSVKLTDLSKQSLKRVNLGWTKINDDNLNRLIESCPSISELSVNTCDHLINPMIQSNNLQFISFQGAHHLQNPILKCNSLKRLDFTNCDNLIEPTLIKKKKKKINTISDATIYQVRKRLNFDQYIESSSESSSSESMENNGMTSSIDEKNSIMNDAPDYTPSPNTTGNVTSVDSGMNSVLVTTPQKRFEGLIEDDDNNECESSPIFHPKMKIIEEENNDELFLY